ncbi:MAG: 23S rRNA pseudouridine synthase F [Candidatus Coatesbacteria bacterium]|nr:MAG: 23S rRNA pseudouridine synthase F [Candidatus Coatesbacteria bacterium]
METRINKYLSEIGYCSRREADRLIDQNKVTINDLVPEKGTKIKDGDIVKVDGVVVNKTVEPIYIALNKPVGITCTTDKNIVGNVVDFMNYPERIFHIGRLDKDSEGLLFMTNDGDIVNKILRAGNNHDKEYLVRINAPITDEFIEGMKSGVPILDTITKPCVVRRTGHKEFKIILTEGMNRQIRKMCDYFGYRVHNLKRIRIMNVNLDVSVGKWRHLTSSEVKDLKALVIDSDKTEDASK